MSTSVTSASATGDNTDAMPSKDVPGRNNSLQAPSNVPLGGQNGEGFDSSHDIHKQLQEERLRRQEAEQRVEELRKAVLLLQAQVKQSQRADRPNPSIN